MSVAPERRQEVRAVVESLLTDLMRQPDGSPAWHEDGLGATPAWDSLAHLEALLAIEARFGVQFATDEMLVAVDVGSLVDVVLQKATAGP